MINGKRLSLVPLLAGLVTLTRSLLAQQVQDPSSPTAVMSVLDLFTAPAVPPVGPEESPGDPPRWLVSANGSDPGLPGGGLRRYPMLYVGEGCNTMFLVNDGKVVWTYSTGKGWEYDDIWLLSNGNILFSRMGWAGEVTPQKKLVWRLEAPKGTEIHAVQPIGLDKVLLMQNGKPPRLVVINKQTGAIEVEHALPDDGKGVHAQFRRLRLTAAGTYLVPFLQMHRVVEYDPDFHEIWSYPIKTPWAAIRPRNGNTLITDESEKLTREVSPKGETVWEIKLSELPEEYRLADTQSCVRLANGNTILCSRGDGGKGPHWLRSRQTRRWSGCSRTGRTSAPPPPSRSSTIRGFPRNLAICSDKVAANPDREGLSISQPVTLWPKVFGGGLQLAELAIGRSD